MKMMRTAAAVSIGKLVLDQARKPENQARIKSALARARSSSRPGRTKTRTATRRPKR